MYIFYVDVGSNIHPFLLGFIREGDVISFDFVANKFANISIGDCYKVTVPSEKHKLFFIIKTGFTVVPNAEVIEYLEKINKTMKIFKKEK